MRPALGDEDALDGCTADDARLAGELIDAVLVLEAAAVAFGIYVVADGRTFAGDGFQENFANRVVEFLQAWPLEAASERKGMNASAEERFVDIDIAEASQE